MKFKKKITAISISHINIYTWYIELKFCNNKARRPKSDVIHFTRSLLCLKWSSSTNFTYRYYVLLLVFKVIIIIKLVFNDRIMRINSVVYGRWIAGWYTFPIWLQLTCILLMMIILSAFPSPLRLCCLRDFCDDWDVLWMVAVFK